MSLLPIGHRVSQFSWVLLGFGLYSYRVREILVCWLFFSGMLAALGLLVTGGILVWYGGEYALGWTSALIAIAPQVAAVPVEVRLRAGVDSRKWNAWPFVHRPEKISRQLYKREQLSRLSVYKIAKDGEKDLDCPVR